jgi:hypothetical protein
VYSSRFGLFLEYPSPWGIYVYVCTLADSDCPWGICLPGVSVSLGYIRLRVYSSRFGLPLGYLSLWGICLPGVSVSLGYIRSRVYSSRFGLPLGHPSPWGIYGHVYSSRFGLSLGYLSPWGIRLPGVYTVTWLVELAFGRLASVAVSQLLLHHPR